jgi:hypothetical protein
VKERAVGFGEIPVARDALQLSPLFSAGMAMGAQVAASQPPKYAQSWSGQNCCCVLMRRLRPRG